jgi:hypothetical protein
MQWTPLLGTELHGAEYTPVYWASYLRFPRLTQLAESDKITLLCGLSATSELARLVLRRPATHHLWATAIRIGDQRVLAVTAL